MVRYVFNLFLNIYFFVISRKYILNNKLYILISFSLFLFRFFNYSLFFFLLQFLVLLFYHLSNIRILVIFRFNFNWFLIILFFLNLIRLIRFIEFYRQILFLRNILFLDFTLLFIQYIFDFLLMILQIIIFCVLKNATITNALNYEQ